MNNLRIFLLGFALLSFFTNQAQATFFITSNLSRIEVSGAVDDFSIGASDTYSDGVTYSSTTIPFSVDPDSLNGEISIASASVSSNAKLDLDIGQTPIGYEIWGNASSHAETAMNSLDDNDATSLGEAVVDLAFTLTSDYSFSFISNAFEAEGAGESEVELINATTGNVVFSQIVSENKQTLDFSGNLDAGNYTLYLGALSNAIDGDTGSSDLEYTLQVTAVPLPASLPLLLSGLAALGFKRYFGHKP